VRGSHLAGFFRAARCNARGFCGRTRQDRALSRRSGAAPRKAVRIGRTPLVDAALRGIAGRSATAIDIRFRAVLQPVKRRRRVARQGYSVAQNVIAIGCGAARLARLAPWDALRGSAAIDSGFIEILDAVVVRRGFAFLLNKVTANFFAVAVC
jgi:hypothetical protein